MSGRDLGRLTRRLMLALISAGIAGIWLRPAAEARPLPRPKDHGATGKDAVFEPGVFEEDVFE